MPILVWIFRLIRWGGRTAARWGLEYIAAGYLASLAVDANRPHEEQQTYRETLAEASRYPSTLRRIFFELLKDAATEAAWSGLVAFARHISERDPELRETARDVIATETAAPA
jgi:hypothetical protein